MKLPKELKPRTLQDLRVGEMAWTVTWALEVDQFDNVMLNLGYSALAVRGEASTLRVTKTPEGYWAEVTDPEETLSNHVLRLGCPPGPLVEPRRVSRSPQGLEHGAL